MAEHGGGPTGAEHVRIVDVARTGADRMHEREHLAAGECAANPAAKAHRVVHEPLDTEPGGERRDEHKTSVRDGRRLIEGHPDAVESARYRQHTKSLSVLV
ncbi:MAG TPA: hypothetical protein VNF07_09540 [Acidimicrobiales bacterium]|nr:hypothetical protein [Acidimicrobiales bacterium]